MMTEDEKQEIKKILKLAGWCLFLIGAGLALFYRVIEYFIYIAIDIWKKGEEIIKRDDIFLWRILSFNLVINQVSVDIVVVRIMIRVIIPIMVIVGGLIKSIQYVRTVQMN